MPWTSRARFVFMPCLITLVSNAAPSKIGYVILSPQQAQPLFSQCSRPSARAQGFWRVDAKQIEVAESALVDALRRHQLKYRVAPSYDPKLWHRQYVGIVTDGRRILYGNFFPSSRGGGTQWETVAVVTCDGNSNFLVPNTM